MRISVLPGDNGGCGRYRMQQPAEAVQKIRPDWEITVHQPRGEVQVGLNQAGKVVQVALDPLPDVMVLQRTGTPILAGVAEWMQERGVAVVTDFDDAMWCIDRKNVAWPSWNMHPNTRKQQHWSWCDHVAKRADLVTVTTEKLARRYGAHGRVAVIGNYVSEEVLKYKPWERQLDEKPVVGWAGYTATHPGDCEISAPAAQAAVELGAKTRAIADAAGVSEAWGLKVDDAVPSQTYGPDYFGAIGTLDLMLVGLKHSPFNECKSTLKVLEAAAAGVPSIAAATSPHRTLARRFPILTAASPAEWKGHATRLIQDPWYRADLTSQVRAAVTKETVEAHAEEWAQAWERARRRRDRI
jgi:glycosyltransferase involved in cell wall biosynthesis